MAIKHITFLALSLCALAIVGCSAGHLPTYPTSGVVQFEDGDPVRFGSIEFYNQQHDVTARGTIDRNGRYELSTFQANDGAIAGEHQVVVIQMLMPNPVVKRSPADASREHQHGRHVGKAYSGYATSSLTCTVEQGDNVHDFTVSE
ncbi:MAG: carboxypeptidase regulatory-like domain-containing protein [Planctomycetaceae bacterium]|nr:carboxypeptidase regulatory-like domain-containing protein [Planctomycetaceae bacterium]